MPGRLYRWLSPWLLLPCLTVSLSLVSCSADPQPNFVIIIADDLGWNDVGAYGNPSVYTPNIDALAQRGIRFTQAFLTTSSCSASRASILTGKYPHSNGLTDLHQPLPASQDTLAKLLGKAGYYTVSSGKWHLGKEVKSQFDLVQRDKKGSGTRHWPRLLQSLPADRPFFLWLASTDPHRPHEEGRAFLSRYDKSTLALPDGFVDGKGVRSELLAYYLEVSSFDEDVGDVLDALHAQGHLNNTVVIVMSDNGRPFFQTVINPYV